MHLPLPAPWPGVGNPTCTQPVRKTANNVRKRLDPPPVLRGKTSDKYCPIGSQRKRWQGNLYRGIFRILRIYAFLFAT